MSSDLVISQQLLEQNEDIIAAIVENLQLGRLNDCMQHYSILQANLVSLATQLDNFPAEEFDPYSKLNIFPDELMRKDILEDLRPVGYRPVPEAALVPACADCSNRGINAVVCRIDLRHVEPSGKFTAAEREEFMHATQVMAAKERQLTQDAQNGKSRRQYKNWSDFEHYTLAVCWRFYGMAMDKMCLALSSRTETQIRSKISHMQKDGNWPPKSAEELLEERDPTYQPPAVLAKFFAAHAAGIDPFCVRKGDSESTDGGDGTEGTASKTGTQSLLAPALGYPDFNLLLSIAAGVSTHDPAALITRVPVDSPPPDFDDAELHANTPPQLPIISDVGIGNADSSRINETLESAYSAVTCGTELRQPQKYGAQQAKPPAGAGSSASTTSADAPHRHVHWGANTVTRVPPPGVEHNSGPSLTASPSSSSSGQGSQFTLPSLRDPNVASYLPPIPAGAPDFLRNPLKEILSGNPDDPHSDAHRHQEQQREAAQRIKEEHETRLRNEREEDALRGLDAYNLKYAMQLKMANIPFRMTTGTGTVVVVKPPGGAPDPTPKPRNKAPPFAQPGMLKRQQEKEEQKRRKMSPSSSSSSSAATGAADAAQTRQVQQPQELSMSPGSFAERVQPRLEEQIQQQQQRHGSKSAAMPSAQDVASHRQQLIQNQKLHKAAASKKSAALETYQMPMAGSLPLHNAGGRDGASSSSGSSSSSGVAPLPISLFGQMLSSGGSEPDLRAASAKSKARLPASSGGSKELVPDNNPAAYVTRPQSGGHASAAVDVSMSGFDEEDANSRHSSSRRAGMSEDSNIRIASEDLSVMHDFEFSFM